MAFVFVTCETTQDCLDTVGPQFCYPNPTFANESVCACSLYFGWTGENCDEGSSVLDYNRVATIFLIIFGFISVLLAARTLALNILIDGVRLSTLFLAALFTFLAPLSELIHLLIKIPSLFDSERFDKIVFQHLFRDDEERIEVIGAPGTLFIKIFGTVFITASLACLMFSWQEVTNKILRFKSSDKEEKGKKALRCLQIFATLYIIILLTFIIGLRALRASYVMVTLVNIVISVMFIIVSNKFRKSLLQLCADQKDNTHLLTVTQNMKFVRNVTVVSLIGVSVSNFLFIRNRDDIHDKVGPGEFDLIHVVRDTGSFFGLLLFTVIAWYVNSVTINPDNAKDYPKVCGCFKCWDTENGELMPSKIMSTANDMATEYD